MVEIKKLMTKEEQDKKKRRNQLIIGGILILIMVFSSAAYALRGEDKDNENKVEYKGIAFLKDSSGLWAFNYLGNNFAVRYNPLELNDTKAPVSVSLSDYKSKVLYFEGENDETTYELKRIFYPFVERIADACLSENCTKDYPLKNCSEDKIISIREPLEGENARVYEDENCIFIVANYSEQRKYADAFLFKVLGI